MGAPIAGCAKVTRDGTVMPLGSRPTAEQSIVESDTKDASKLSRFLGKLFTDVAALRARFYPRRIDFEDITVTVASITPLKHQFGSRVRWWVVDWVSTGAANATQFETHATSDSNTLRLYSGEAGIATIRVEESG